jgi:hypothetical protein
MAVTWRRALLAAVALVFALGVAYALTLTTGSDTDAQTLADITDLEDLKAQFNADEGRPRLVLLMSPT